MNQLPIFKAPIFIVGFNGSGTTMLADSLNNHPDIYIFPEETKILPFILKNKDKYGDLSIIKNQKKLAEEMIQYWAFWEINDRNYPEIQNDLLSGNGVADVLHSVYGFFARKALKKRWGEKTPMYLQHIELISENVKDAKIIHLFRDGRDVARSLHRRWARDPERTVFRWKLTTQLAREQGKKIGSHRYIELKYEDLTLDPRTHMKNICDFLNIPFYSGILKSSMPYMDTNSDRKASGRIKENSGKWKKYFNNKVIRKMEKICGQYLSEIGYPDISIYENCNINRLKLKYLKTKDQYINLALFIKKRGISSIPRLIRRLKLTHIQNKYNVVK